MALEITGIESTADYFNLMLQLGDACRCTENHLRELSYPPKRVSRAARSATWRLR
jgi:hypothetical protein